MVQPNDAPQAHTEHDKGKTSGRPRKTREIRLESAAEMEVTRARWLEGGTVPLDAITLLAGREGLGKSTWALDLAARVSRGHSHGEFWGRRKGVLIISTEDDWPSQTLPRLIAAESDLARVWKATDVVEHSGDPDEGAMYLGAVDLSIDLVRLEELIKEHDVGLVILDPLTSRLGRQTDTHKDSSVRIVLERLSRLAQKTGCAVLGVIHLNKSQSDDLANQVMGSRAFAAVTRSLLVVLRDPEDDEARLIGVAKSNVADDNKPAKRFRIESTTLEIQSRDGLAITTTRVVEDGDSGLTIREANAQINSRGGETRVRKVKPAEEFLVRQLEQHGGKLPRADLMELNKVRGSEADSEQILQRAASALGIDFRREGWPATTVWRTPAEGWPERVQSIVEEVRESKTTTASETSTVKNLRIVPKR